MIVRPLYSPLYIHSGTEDDMLTFDGASLPVSNMIHTKLPYHTMLGCFVYLRVVIAFWPSCFDSLYQHNYRVGMCVWRDVSNLKSNVRHRLCPEPHALVHRRYEYAGNTHLTMTMKRRHKYAV